MVWDLDMIRQALCAKSQEPKRLQSCLSVVDMALAAADRETTMAEASVG